MIEIEAAAREVVAAWEKGDLAGKVRHLSQLLDEMQAARDANPEIIQAARNGYDDENIRVDATPIVATGDSGAWVSAFVWVGH